MPGGAVDVGAVGADAGSAGAVSVVAASVGAVDTGATGARGEKRRHGKCCWQVFGALRWHRCRFGRFSELCDTKTGLSAGRVRITRKTCQYLSHFAENLPSGWASRTQNSKNLPHRRKACRISRKIWQSLPDAPQKEALVKGPCRRTRKARRPWPPPSVAAAECGRCRAWLPPRAGGVAECGQRCREGRHAIENGMRTRLAVT